MDEELVMNKWVVYWMLHFLGFVGLMSTLPVLKYGLLPAYAMGAIGGSWMAACICLARWLVMRRSSS